MRIKSKHGFDTTAARSLLMSKIKGVNTSPEILLRKALWSIGIRYRLNVASLPGKPDIVINKHKIVIFIDGEFWHGYKWEDKKPKIKANREYWIKKIEGNIQRDKKHTTELISQGFTVLRFWEQQIKRDLKSCIEEVVNTIEFNSQKMK